MTTKTREYACSEPNELTGYPITEEQKKKWLNKIRANGVKEGDEVLVIGGPSKDQVVTFSYDEDFLEFSDCGVTREEWLGGWFYLASEDKACKPLYYDFTNVVDHEGELEQKNAVIVSTTAIGANIVTLIGYCGKGQNNSTFTVDDLLREDESLDAILKHESTTHRCLAFDSAREMYIYLAHLETI